MKRYPPIIFNSSVIEKVSNHMHLGITLNETLSWDNHINELIKRTTGPIGLLKHLSHSIDRNSKLRVYTTLFDRNLNMVPKCLLATSRIVWRAFSARPSPLRMHVLRTINKDVGLEPLMLHRKYFRLCHFYKIVHGLVPQYLVTLCNPICWFNHYIQST